MRKKWKAMFQQELKEDAKRIMEEVNRDPNLKDVEAPEEIHTKLMQQIREYEDAKNPVDERLTVEERELIRLGMVYKRTRRWTRYVVIAAAVVTMLAVGITSVGGPKKVIEVVREMVSERERMKVNIDKDRIDEQKVKGEYEAYLKIEETFKSKSVSMYYLPKELHFSECDIDEKLQKARLNYEGENNQTLTYHIPFQYRATVAGVDVEDELVREYVINVEDYEILIKQYEVVNDNDSRWRAEIEHQKVHYFIEINGLKQQEVEKIVKNLHFY